ncbi:MAG: nicotinamide mononucleotide transporter [Muribaculaceae bacterium]|nr:nicotinamide mononucleotide transporter [Muribaculaceae bacterium]
MDRFLDILGFVTGILYLYWEYFANPKMWIAELIMPVIMTWLFFDKGLYGDCAMNAYYFVIAIYGYICWTRSKSAINTGNQNKKERPIEHIPAKYLFAALAVFVAIYVLATFALLQTDSTVPYLDAFTTSLSIVAMWMLARKYLEQWFAWILVDIVSCGLYIYKDIPLSATRYAIYTVIAFFGYYKWKRMMAE